MAGDSCANRQVDFIICCCFFHSLYLLLAACVACVYIYLSNSLTTFCHFCSALTNQPLNQDEGQIFDVRMKASEAKEDHL